MQAHGAPPTTVAPAPAAPAPSQAAPRPLYFANAKSLNKADKAASAAAAAARATWAKGGKSSGGSGTGKRLCPKTNGAWRGLAIIFDHAPTERCFRAPWFKGDETIPV